MSLIEVPFLNPYLMITMFRRIEMTPNLVFVLISLN